MRKRIKGRSLGRERAQKRALMRTLMVSLLDKQKITTTLAKAKELSPFAEKRMTLAKRGLENDVEKMSKIRLLKKDLPIKSVEQLFSIAAIAKRDGGYTRIVKLMSRKSDFAKMAMIEWVDKVKVSKVDTSKKAVVSKEKVEKKEVVEKEAVKKN